MSLAIPAIPAPAAASLAVSVRPAAVRIASFYDGLATRYDVAYAGRREAMENLALRVLLPLAGVVPASRFLPPETVLDLGCGTGLLLDLAGPAIRPTGYLGVDLSPGMLAQARRKHPGHDFLRRDLADVRGLARYASAVVSLFCAVNYARPATVAAALASVLAPGGRFFLMALAGDYRPVQHTPALDALLHPWPPAAALAALRGAGLANLAARPFTWPLEARPGPLAWLAARQVARTLAGPDALALPPDAGHRYVILTGRQPRDA